MKWHYDLTGAEPIIRDLPVYDATSLANGELLMLGTTANSTADGGVSLITAGTGTSGNDAIDAVGILTESTYESGGTAPTRTIDSTSGVYFGKTIINPFAVYLAEVNKAAAQDIAVESSSTTTTIYETLSAIGATNLDGYWVLFTDVSTTAAVKGCLRMITDNGATTFTIPALPATPATTDVYIFANPVHAYIPALLSGDARTINCGGVTLDAPEGATNLRCLCSYASSDKVSVFPLKTYVHGGTMNLGTGASLFEDIMMKDHLYGVQE